MTFTAEDRRHMARALQLAESVRHLTRENPRVGCVLVNQGEVIAEGATQPPGSDHAEAQALKRAQGRTGGATAYVTLEPCSHFGRTPPCADALVNAGVKRVVVAAGDPNPKVNGQGLAKLKDAGIQVDVGLMEGQAEAINFGFNRRMRGGLPAVTVKIACSMDGATAMSSGESQWITSPYSRVQVQKLRAQAGAIVTGVGTLMADDPRLTVRFDEAGFDFSALKPADQPLRVVMDRQGLAPATRQFFRTPGPTMVACEAISPVDQQSLENTGAEVATFEQLTPENLLRALSAKNINEVFVEAGPTLSGAFLQAGVVDRLVIFQAPLLMGSQTKPLMHTPAITQLTQALKLKRLDTRVVGPDLMHTFEIQAP